jgi:hypothetical protein
LWHEDLIVLTQNQLIHFHSTKISKMSEPVEITLDYPLDSMISIEQGMTLSTDTGDAEVLEYRGSEVYHRDAMNEIQQGYAPKQLPDAYEWRRYTILVRKS